MSEPRDWYSGSSGDPGGPLASMQGALAAVGKRDDDALPWTTITIGSVVVALLVLTQVFPGAYPLGDAFGIGAVGHPGAGCRRTTPAA